MADLFSLAKPLEEPDRSGFIKAAMKRSRSSGRTPPGRASFIACLRRYGASSSIRLPRTKAGLTTTAATITSRGRGPGSREAVRRPDEGSQTRRRPVAGIRQSIE